MENTYVNTENLRVSEGDAITSEVMNRALENTDANHEALGNEKVLLNAYYYNNGSLTIEHEEFEPADLYDTNVKKRAKVWVSTPYNKLVLLPFYEHKQRNTEYGNKTTYSFRNGSDEVMYILNGSNWDIQYHDVGLHRHNVKIAFDGGNVTVYLTITNNSNVAINDGTIGNYLENEKSATGSFYHEAVIAIQKIDYNKYRVTHIDGVDELSNQFTITDVVE